MSNTKQRLGTIGYVETLTKNRISGWALKKIGGKFHPAILTIKLTDRSGNNEISIKIRSNLYRSDLELKYGVKYGGFAYDFSFDVIPSDILVCDEENFSLEVICHEKQNVLNIDKLDGRFISGWLVSNSGTDSVEIRGANNTFSKTIFANEFREDLLHAGISDGFSGFSTRILTPRIGAFSVGHQDLKETIAIKTTLKITIVSESPDKNNPTRVYRCDHLADLLRNKQCDINVISQNEFWSNEPSASDIFIFSRVGVNVENRQKLIDLKKKTKARIIVEVDDLIFLPWYADQSGAFRSGSIAEREKYSEHIKQKLNTLLFCDAAIVSSSKLLSVVNSLGIEAIKIPNLMRERYVRAPIARTSKVLSESVKIIYMSGSHTHDADFSVMAKDLYRFLMKNTKCHLTVLGRLNESQLHQLSRLSNVSLRPYAHYEEMLNIVSQSSVCLVPLENTIFNDCKSDLKYLECGSQRVPVISSSVEEFKESITDGEDGILVARDSDWLATLDETLSNPSLLIRLGDNAHRTISTHRTIGSYKEKYSKDIIDFICGSNE